MSGIEYISGDLSTHPQCAHGPTLLFSRSVNDTGDRRNFFACSACRDRKLCTFFSWEGERDTFSDARQLKWKTEQKKLTQDINHRKLFLDLCSVQQLSENMRTFCTDCSTWVLQKNIDDHKNHELQNGITDSQISNPSTFLVPLSNTKKEAQYLFSQTAVKTIVQILQDLDIQNVLCIGTPRIHENIQSQHATHMSSLLLDFDQRFHSFFGPLQYCWYNLFNHHFFLQSSKSVFTDFLQSNGGKQFAVLMDPPFGGRIEPIANTLKQIEAEYQQLNKSNETLPVFLFFPYFMEPQILNSLPNYNMADYKVEYDNHALFKDDARGRKFGSPVRIFTNLSLDKIKLSEEQGYKYCKICKRWVYPENKHCKKCEACTSKDGRAYKHCSICNRCVKPTWGHCTECSRCAQPDHVCGNVPFTQSCFHCKEKGHKKNECPRVNHEELKRKRNKKHSNKNKKNKNIL